MAYGSSQARGQIGTVVASLPHSHSNAGSLTHRAGPGIEPSSSWILVRFMSMRLSFSDELPGVTKSAPPRLRCGCKAVGSQPWLYLGTPGWLFIDTNALFLEAHSNRSGHPYF